MGEHVHVRGGKWLEILLRQVERDEVVERHLVRTEALPRVVRCGVGDRNQVGVGPELAHVPEVQEEVVSGVRGDVDDRGGRRLVPPGDDEAQAALLTRADLHVLGAVHEIEVLDRRGTALHVVNRRPASPGAREVHREDRGVAGAGEDVAVGVGSAVAVAVGVGSVVTVAVGVGSAVAVGAAGGVAGVSSADDGDARVGGVVRVASAECAHAHDGQDGQPVDRTGLRLHGSLLLSVVAPGANHSVEQCPREPSPAFSRNRKGNPSIHPERRSQKTGL